MVLSQFGCSGVVYSNYPSAPEAEDNFDGTCVCSNDILTLSLLHRSINKVIPSNYEIEKLDSSTMVLRDKELGAVSTYYKVIGQYAIHAGCSVLLGDAFKASVYSTDNSAIASVDALGNILATGMGITFVSISSDQVKTMAMVEVTARVPDIINSLLSSIDDVKNKYGKPSADLLDSQKQNAYLYNNPTIDNGLAELAFIYDKQSREVIQVNCLYANEEGAMVDLAYIEAQYPSLIEDMYYEVPQDERNRFLILHSKTDDNSHILAFRNYQYLLRHK